MNHNGGGELPQEDDVELVPLFVGSGVAAAASVSPAASCRNRSKGLRLHHVRCFRHRHLQLVMRGLLWLSLGAALLHTALKVAVSHYQATPMITTESYSYPERLPQVAWLLSFGGSGTSYTILNLERITGYSTASNYGSGYIPCLPVHPNPNPTGRNSSNSTNSNTANSNGGPYIRSPQKPLPATFILTKSHCGGFCMDCPPKTYLYDNNYMNTTSFSQACASGKRRNSDGTVDSVTYYNDSNNSSTTMPTRAVHLIRNPYDNLVARMHLANRRKARKNASAVAYETSPAGVLEWCAYLDEAHAAAEAKLPATHVLRRFAHIPCHAEWFKYVQWHTLALQEATFNMPVHNMWYESYTKDWSAAVDGLTQFLQYTTTSVNNNLGEPWHGSPSYELDATLMEQAAGMMHELANPAVWRLIGHYLQPYLPAATTVLSDGDSMAIDDYTEYRDDDTESSSNFFSGDDDNVEDDDSASRISSSIIDDDNDYRSKSKARLDPDAGITNNNSNETKFQADSKNPQVVWFLSYPNSGSKYTIDNLEQMGNVSTASNYAKTWEVAVPVRPELTEGPFLHALNRRTPDYVLTVTHCGDGGAGGERQAPYTTVSHSENDADADFLLACLASEKPVSETEYVATYYEPAVPVKAVHWIRSPFDTIVARMRFKTEKLLAQQPSLGGWDAQQISQFENSKDGLDAWCAYHDNNNSREQRQKGDYLQADKPLLSDDVLALLEDLPCHAEWYRYVQWHNRAYRMTTTQRKQLRLPVHYLYHEKYATDYDETVSDLLQFLNTTAVHPPAPFAPGINYITFYTVATARKAMALVQALAEPEVWELLRPYFTKWL